VIAREAMPEGSHFATATSAEVEAAERFCSMVPSAEAVRFTNTGSEATMLALRLARAHTGRTKFLKFEGHYHGWYDPYLLNAHGHPPQQLGPTENPSRIPDSEGIPPATFDDVVLAPWNDLTMLERIMQKHGRELAAVITEPIMANMGCIPPREGYLQRLRELTRDYGVLLILDEVVTGFRYAPGGCQQYYGIEPDISTFGKALGAGFPVGAVAGPRSILERMRWSDNMVLHYGTFNGHRLTMKVVAANLNTGLTRDTSTANDGGYVFPLVPVGFYSVTVEAQGFRRFEQRGVPRVRPAEKSAPIRLRPEPAQHLRGLGVPQFGLLAVRYRERPGVAGIHGAGSAPAVRRGRAPGCGNRSLRGQSRCGRSTRNR